MIELDRVCQSYYRNGIQQQILQEVSLSVARGESCAIVGSSGSGKSTLLNILGLLDRPLSGRFLLDGFDISHSTADACADLRNRLIGFVFQGFNLLPRLSVLDNVALPLLYRGCPGVEARQRAICQLERIGLAERFAYRPTELSGGQCQRVAIARALVGEPALILADEPTGNLDNTTAQDIMDLLLQLNECDGVTLIMVTHDKGLASQLGRQLLVRDGRVVELELCRQGATSNA